MKAELEAPSKPNVILTLTDREARLLIRGLETIPPSTDVHASFCGQLRFMIRNIFETTQ